MTDRIPNPDPRILPLSLAGIADAVVACEKCPRLRTYCEAVAREKKRAHRDETYWGRPVPGFGDPAARLLIVGLAPAAHGGNRTGRVFTGDSSGDFLMRALHAAGFANQATSRHRDDGLALIDTYIAATARCAPPDNKPTPAEIARCLPYLSAEIRALNRLRAVVALGRIAFDACLTVFGWSAESARGRRPTFAHGGVHPLGDQRPTLIASYHPSRQNTNTGRLTPVMFDAVFAETRRLLGGGSRGSSKGGRWLLEAEAAASAEAGGSLKVVAVSWGRGRHPACRPRRG